MGTVSWVVDDGVTLAVPAVLAADFLGPEGLAMGRNGALLVVEAGAGKGRPQRRFSAAKR